MIHTPNYLKFMHDKQEDKSRCDKNHAPRQMNQLVLKSDQPVFLLWIFRWPGGFEILNYFVNELYGDSICCRSQMPKGTEKWKIVVLK
jgi:hypothetical protein